METDAEVKRFIRLNYTDDIKRYDFELMRDILTLSKLYDRNFDRIVKSTEGEIKDKNRRFKNIEEKLGKVSQLMREAAGIKSRI